jgi:chromosome segregation ATPase
MRLDSEARLRATETESQARINAMSAELTRLRRERDAIQEKLDAIADIEKSLMERDDAASAPPDSTTP